MKIIERFLIAGIVTLVLNLVWEFSHYSLYVDLSGITKNLHLIIASFADMLIILGIFVMVSLKNKNFNWMKSPKRFDYILVAVIGFVVASFIEIINLKLGRWAYTNIMPTFFGIGISPLIQLVLTAIISLIIINYIEK